MYILQAYRRYKLKKYISQLQILAQKTYQLYSQKDRSHGLTNSLTRKRIAIENKWPIAPRTLVSVVNILKKIYKRWKAWLLIHPIPVLQWPEFRLKIIASSALGGQRTNYALNEPWLGNYLALPETHLNANNFKNIFKQLLPNTPILFSSRAIKASKSWLNKNVDRWIIVTEHSIHRIDPKTLKLVGTASSIADATGISITKGLDQLVAVNIRGGNDLILAFVDSDDHLQKPVNRVGEFVATLLKQYSM